MSSTYRPIAPIATQSDIYAQPITSLAFDPVSDVLWTGNNAGSVVAFYGTQGARGVSFPVGGDLAVKKILVGDQYVRALGSAGSGVGSWSKGGLNKWFYRSLHAVTTFSNAISASPNLAVSTNVPELALVNSSTGSLVRQSPVPSLITHLASSHTLLLSGSADGYLRTHDVRVGKKGDFSEASVKAHLKGVQGLEVSGNLVFTIGWGERQSRPFPEPLVKVYDLRSFKALPPVSFSAGPGFINALPRRSSSVVVTSNRGLVNIVDTSNPGDGGEFYQLDVPSYVSSVAVSATGVYLAFGDGEGNVQLMTAADEEGSLPFNGFEGQPVEWPDVSEPLPDITWTDSTPLNSIGMPYYDTLLLSSWTPKFLPANLSYPPPAKIPSQIENTMKVNEFVAYATMPKELQGRRNVVHTGPKKDMARFRSGRPRIEQSEPETHTLESAEDIPRAFREVVIQYSKFGVEDFDFAFYNKTEYSGLESHIVNSYTNCLIQSLHYCLPIRRLAESHILTNCNREHCFLCELGFAMRMLKDARGVNCQASNFCKTVGALAQAHNQIAHIDFGKPIHSYSDTIQGFHRFLLDQLSSEGNNFPRNPLIVPSQNAAPSMIAAPVTQLLGLDAKTNIYCSSCKGRRQKENMTHVVDLIFPKSGLVSPASSSDFTNIVRESLFRGSAYKATCPLCKQFSTNESRKSIPSKDLPAILALNTSIYESGIASHRLWLDGRHRQGTFVQPFIEIRGQVDGVDEADVVQYELRSMVVEVVPEGKKYGHLVSIVKVPESERHSLRSPWMVFNDFVVTNASEHDALGFPGTWKVPALLYYERIDMRDRLNYKDLTQELDLSILCRDINISPVRDNASIKHELLGVDELPRPGTMVAIDAEFVSMQQEESEYRSDGTKKVLRPARLGLARVSVLRAADGVKLGVPFIDDHIHTSEAIVDYLTEYSGIKYGDLDPHLSRHTLVPLKVAYKKLRLLVDLGCVFIGHGLKKDFRIINLFVPPDRVLDTVDIYFIEPRQRRLSLRFLSWIVLKQNIQAGEHDSIEDARCALLLFRAFQEYEEKGVWDEKLEELYREGKQHNWKPPQLPTPPTPAPLQSAAVPPMAQIAMHHPYGILPNNVLQAFNADFRAAQHSQTIQMPRHTQPSFGVNPMGTGSPLQQNWRRTHR
ncbi:ubiquitin carboxyl-terminal hydrolase-domain-containing protein [Phellopilus nigrolimitatus]|nr:ubiquitin carboxyl-terminal hydrolase-domain-containing protein [Phellopilus nigrolimitatus]